ncbi:hypothetical protein FPQ18DRAFT_379456 [Pyronema domesticum]|nr:hypothetical protein FPQ18DRAFT_379456 [Pyronema domesticum]
MQFFEKSKVALSEMEQSGTMSDLQDIDFYCEGLSKSSDLLRIVQSFRNGSQEKGEHGQIWLNFDETLLEKLDGVDNGELVKLLQRIQRPTKTGRNGKHKHSLRFRASVQRFGTLVMPLKPPFGSIVQKASVIPVYSLLAIAVFYNRTKKFEQADRILQIILRIIEHQKISSTHFVFDFIGKNLEDKKDFEGAEQFYRLALDRPDPVTEKEHKAMLQRVFSVGRTVYQQNRYSEAEALFRRAFEGQSKILGVNHGDTLSAMHWIAKTKFQQGEYIEAEILFGFAVSGREKCLRDKWHNDTWESTLWLGKTLYKLKRHDDARPFLSSAIYGPRHGNADRNWLRRLISKQNHTFHPWSNSWLRKRDDKLGRDHLLSLEAAYLLGETYFHDQTCVKLERYVEASLYHFTALDGKRELLGTDHEDYRVAVIAYRNKDYTQALDKFGRMVEERLTHVPDGKCPDIWRAHYWIAKISSRKEKYAEAADKFQWVLDQQKEGLGKEHLDTMSTAHWLGRMLWTQKKYDESVAVFQDLLESQQKALGLQHRDTMLTAYWIGATAYQQQKYTEAEAVFRRCLEDNQNVYGNIHRVPLCTSFWLAVVLYRQKKHAESESIQRRTLEGRKEVLRDGHRNILRSSYWLARVLFDEGKYAEATVHFRNTLEGRKKITPLEDDKIVDCAHWVVKSLQGETKHTNIETILLQELATCQEVPGLKRIVTMKTMHWTGRVLYRRQKYDKAEIHLRQSFEGQQKQLGPAHQSTLDMAFWLGCCLYHQGKHVEAEPILRETMRGWTKVYGIEHVDTAWASYWLASNMRKLGQLEESETLFRQALDRLKKRLGDQHNRTVSCVRALEKMVEELRKESLLKARPTDQNLIEDTRRTKLQPNDESTCRAPCSTQCEHNKTRSSIAVRAATHRGRPSLAFFFLTN